MLQRTLILFLSLEMSCAKPQQGFATAGQGTGEGEGEAGEGEGEGEPAEGEGEGEPGEGEGEPAEGEGEGEPGEGEGEGEGEVATSTGRYFPDGNPWDRDVSNDPVDPASDAIIEGLDALGGFGTGTMRVDFSIEVLTADDSTPKRTFNATGDFFDPDCDQAPMPVPAVGALEGESGYVCEGDGDCHLIVHDTDNNVLYEMWRANIVGDQFDGGCMAVWDLGRVYPENGRGDQCTSADAAGYPIAPLLFTADEVASGEINHAIRFILPNERIQNGVYVHPATHSTNATSGDENTPPYGARLRLKADFDVENLPTEGAKVVARALQRYGMLLSDGGNIALTAQSDRFTAAKWSDVLGPRDLEDIPVTAFEMVDGGERIDFTADCVRNPL